MKVVIGIDPGLAATGYGVIVHEGSGYQYLGHGVIRTTAQQDTGTRLVQIHSGLKEVITRYQPTEAGVETLYFAKNLKSAIPVAQARGVILYTLAELSVPFSEHTPLEVKQAIIGHGRADKRQVQEVIKLLFRLHEVPKPDHGADALAIAFCCANYAHGWSYLQNV